MSESLDKQVSNLQKKLKKINEVEFTRAHSKALNNSAKRISTRVIRGVAAESKLPQKPIRKRVYIKRSTAKTQKAVFRVYHRDIPVSSLLKDSVLASAMGRGTNRRGVRVAGRQYDGAFINKTKKGGRAKVFRRIGRRRMPLEMIKIKIRKPVNRITKTVAARVMAQDYKNLYAHELKYRLNKYKV